MTRPLRLFMVAGEVSGDVLGARLMAALRRMTDDRIVFDGIGGPGMMAQGLTSRFPMEDLSLMGIAEILPHLPKLLRHLSQTSDAVQTSRPDALITIDAPAFSLRLARRVGPGVTRRIHYVAPQVWAWRPGRAVKIARSVDRLLTLLPFEPPYFTPHGLPSDYVGHPVIESGVLSAQGDRYRGAVGLSASEPLLLVLPGSRHGEVSRLLPIFRATLEQVLMARPEVRIVVALVPAVASAVQDGLAGLPILFHQESKSKFDVFAAADAALAASGTVTLELGLVGTPAVVGYRVAPVTAWLLRHLLRIPHVALPNIVLDERVYPELLQENCSPAQLSAALLPLLQPSSPAALAQRDGLKRLRERMEAGGESPSERAARCILADLAQHHSD